MHYSVLRIKSGLQKKNKNLENLFIGIKNIFFVNIAQKRILTFVTFVNTYREEYDIIILVKTPNTLYIVFAIPHSKNTFS